MSLDISFTVRTRSRSRATHSTSEGEKASGTGTYATVPNRSPPRSPCKLHDGERKSIVSPAPWLILPAGNLTLSYRVAKRTCDLVGAMGLLILFSPVLLITVLVLMVTTRGRPIFAQERVGHLGRRFHLYKFRTMVLDADKIRHVVKNEQDGPIFKNRTDPRITRIGRILRRTSIDEMPQLINVLRGEMSLVGPRPPLADEVAQYRPSQRKRLTVKPGLTCLWQVSGRSEIGFDRWMVMDRWYVKRQGLATDLSLLLRTPWAVISRRGAF